MILESLKLVQHYVKAEQEEYRGTMEQLEGYKDLFWLSGWVSALSYAVSVIAGEIKHKCNAQSRS